MVDAATFRTVFPELASAPYAQVAFWLAQAPFAQIEPVGGLWPYAASYYQSRLGGSYDLAVMLFAAHNIALSMRDAAAAAKGQAPGTANSLVASKAAGGLAVSYDTSSIATDGAGIYNATSYGQRLWKMLEIAAMGGTYAPAPRRRYDMGRSVFGRFLR